MLKYIYIYIWIKTQVKVNNINNVQTLGNIFPGHVIAGKGLPPQCHTTHSYDWCNPFCCRQTQHWRCVTHTHTHTHSLGLSHMWSTGSDLMMLPAEIKHLTFQFQQSSLSIGDVSFLIYHSGGIWFEWSAALYVPCTQHRTWFRHMTSRWVLVFYGRVPVSHWHPHPQGINLNRSRGIRRGSCTILVIYAFINNRKELWLGLFGWAPPLWSKSRLPKSPSPNRHIFADSFIIFTPS